MHRCNAHIVDVNVQSRDVAVTDNPFWGLLHLAPIEAGQELSRAISATCHEDSADFVVIEHILQCCYSLVQCAGVSAVTQRKILSLNYFQTPRFQCVDTVADVLIARCVARCADSHLVALVQSHRQHSLSYRLQVLDDEGWIVFINDCGVHLYNLVDNLLLVAGRQCEGGYHRRRNYDFFHFCCVFFTTQM